MSDIHQITDRERELESDLNELRMKYMTALRQADDALQLKDRYQDAADRMAAAHKVERDDLTTQLEKKSSAIQKLWADRDALAAENERLKAELGDLPKAQAEMLTMLKQLETFGMKDC